jgi:hypothetical protein
MASGVSRFRFQKLEQDVDRVYEQTGQIATGRRDPNRREEP